jgi:hypothetical protein
MKKSLIALGLSAVMVAATAVPALADDASLNIYGIYKAGDQTWFIDEGAAAQKAVEAAGGTFTFVDAKMSPEEYKKILESARAYNERLAERGLHFVLNEAEKAAYEKELNVDDTGIMGYVSIP